MGHLECLAKQSKIEVREKASTIEALSALVGAEIEMANRYQIFAEGGEQEIFFAAEKTGCCTRQLKQLCPDCAPWDLEILHRGDDGNYAKAFHMDRPCTYTCCCFNRPVVQVKDVMGGRKLGSIQDPFACCDLTFKIRGSEDQDVLKAKGGCCQWGLCCPLPCGPCSVVEFKIEDMQGKEVGLVKKKVPGCCKFLFASDVDNYKIDFGAVEDSKLKALIMGLSLFIDFRYFNDNKSDNP